jgi:hypothetical protein
MPKKKSRVPHRHVTGRMADEVATNDYGCVATGQVIDGVHYAESASVPASERREELRRELGFSTAGES